MKIFVKIVFFIFSIATVSVIVSSLFEWRESIEENKGQKLSYVSGIVRQQLSGDWFVQNDTDHTPLNIGSVGILGDKIRIYYQAPVKKVVSLVVTPDDALAKKGYVVSGSSVGLEAADFGVGRMLNLYGGVSYSKNSWIQAYQNSNEYKLTLEERPDGVLRVWHKEDDFGLIPTQLTARDGGYIPQLYTFDPHYFDVRFYDHGGNLVTTFDDKCSFLFNRSGYRMVDVTTEKFPPDGNFWIMGVMEINDSQ